MGLGCDTLNIKGKKGKKGNKGKKVGLPLEWQIAIITTLIVVIVAILGWPTIQDKWFKKHPDTYVCLYGMNHSYTIDQLKETAPIRSKITLVPIQFPEGVSSLKDTEIPVMLFNWTYSDDEKLYVVTAYNKGHGVARKLKVDIDFTPNSIVSVNITNEERVKIIQGGKPTATRAVFEIDELLPDERQAVQILVYGKSIKSVDVWSETEGTVKNVFIFDIAIEPDKDFAP